MKIGMSRNECGTLISLHRCETCGKEFTLCPARSDDAPGWENCLARDCASYDEARDADRLFDRDDPAIKRVPGKGRLQ